MLLVLVLGVVSMAAWSLAFLTTRDLIRTEKLVQQRENRDAGVTRGLAAGLRLMRTGLPPRDPYECIAVLTSATEKLPVLLTFQRGKEDGHWRIDATVASVMDMSTLPEVPSTFELPSPDPADESGGSDDDGDEDDDDRTLTEKERKTLEKAARKEERAARKEQRERERAARKAKRAKKR